MIACAGCNGTGWLNPTCEECHGEGWTWEETDDGSIQEPCRSCRESGIECEYCDGLGR